MQAASIRFHVHIVLVALMLTAWGCAPRVKADVLAVSSPGYTVSGQTCIVLPGPGMAGIPPSLFAEASGRVRAALAGKGFRPVENENEAEMAVRVSWATHGPYETREPLRPTPSLSSPFGWARQMSGAYGRAGYGGFGVGYGEGWTIKNVYQHELVLEARRRSQTKPDIPPTATDTPASPEATSQSPDYTRPPYAPPLPVPNLTPASRGRTPVTPLPPAGSASGTVSGTDEAGLALFGGEVLWRVVVSSDSQRSAIDPILPHLISAAARWMGISTSTRVTIDEELNVTPRGD